MTRVQLSLALTFALATLGCPGEDDPEDQGSGTSTSTATGDSPGTESTDGSGSAGSTSTGEDTSTGGDTSTSTTQGALEVVPVDRALIERYAGPWSGPVSMTPWGVIPEFPVDFVWEGDDLLSSETLIPDSDGYFVFTFVETEGGSWSLVEEGKLPGGPTQSYTLDPVEVSGDTSRWVYLPDPDFLALQITVSDAELVFETYLRGESHATFNLAPNPG